MNPAQRVPLVYLKLVLTAVFWGGTFIAGRIVSAEAGPFSAAFLRFLAASLILLGFVWKTLGTLPRLERGQILAVLLMGLTGVFAYNALFFSGLKTVAAGRASLIITSNPAFIALFSALIFHDKLSLLKTLGILLSISGAMIVISKGNPLHVLEGGFGPGELYLFGCVMSWVVYSLIGKVALARLSPLVSVTWACVIGGVLLLPPALLEGLSSAVQSYSLAAWLSILYLGLFGTSLGFIWYYEGIRTIGPARTGVFINLVPVCAVVMAFLILGEAIDASITLGAILVFAGVYLTNRP